MYFRDRKDAGRQLAEALQRRGYERPLVLGIPRGGLPVATEVARALGGDLAVVVARKLGAPGNPELAIGATTANGVAWVNEAVAREVGAKPAYIAAERERQTKEAQRREELFNGHRRPPVQGRTVIVVDDGIATGATAIAAVRSMKAAGAARVVLAIPVGPAGTTTRMQLEADEVVCLSEEPQFWAVGQFYDNFRPVEDEEVKAILDAYQLTAAHDPREAWIKRDSIYLSARLRTPAGEGPFPCVVFVHGLGSSKESPRNVTIAERLVDEGIAALLFDLSGHGQSWAEPRADERAFIRDLVAVFEWAREQVEIDPNRIGLAGSSLGAVIVARAVLRGLVRPAAVVLRAPPLGPGDFDHLGVPTQVVIGSADPLLAQVRAGVETAPQRVSLFVVPRASHLFEEPGTLEEALVATVSWFRNRLVPGVAARPHGS